LEPAVLIGAPGRAGIHARIGVSLMAWAAALLPAGLGGCCGSLESDEYDPPSQPGEHDPNEGWRLLFDRDDATGWLTVKGRMLTRNGVMHLNPEARQKKTITVGLPMVLRDGVVEVEALRDPNGYANPAPYTIALRVRPALDWSALYMVCRSGRLDIHRGTHKEPYPEATAKVPFEPVTGSRTWRFEMDGETIRILLNGRHVHTYTDPSPRAGTMAITADRCRLKVYRVDVKPDDGK
jgi:hypothetical protein